MIPGYKSACRKIKLNFGTDTLQSVAGQYPIDLRSRDLYNVSCHICPYCKSMLSSHSRYMDQSTLECVSCRYKFIFSDIWRHNADTQRILTQITYSNYVVGYNAMSKGLYLQTSVPWTSKAFDMDCHNVDLQTLLNKLNVEAMCPKPKPDVVVSTGYVYLSALPSTTLRNVTH